MQVVKNTNWEIQPLGKLAEFIIGGDWGKDISYDNDEFKVVYCIRGSELKKWEENKGNTAAIRKVKTKSLEKRQLQEGDILIEISGGGPEQPVGRTVVIDKDVLSYEQGVPKVCTNFFRLFRPIDGVNPKYLNLFLTLFYSSGEIVKYQAGSNNLRNLKFKEYLTIPIPLPSLPEQHRIVEKIEKLFAELDRGVAALKKAKDQLKVYRQSVLKWAFEGRLTDPKLESGQKPSNWTYPKLIDVVALSKSKFKPVEPSEEFYIGLEHIEKDTGKLTKNASSELIRTIKNKFEPGDLLYGKLRPYLNKVYLAQESGVCSTDILVFNLSDSIIGEYIKMLFLSMRFVNDMSSNTTGVNLPRVSTKYVQNYHIPLPPLKEQINIIQELESRFFVVGALEKNIEETLLKTEALKQSILKSAFEGRLV